MIEFSFTNNWSSFSENGRKLIFVNFTLLLTSYSFQILIHDFPQEYVDSTTVSFSVNRGSPCRRTYCSYCIILLHKAEIKKLMSNINSF